MANATEAMAQAVQSALAYQTAHYDDDKSPLIIGVCIFNITMVVLTVAIRLYAQNVIGKIFSADSWLICFAALLAIATNACTIISAENGMGKHQLRVLDADSHPPQKFVQVFKMGYYVYLFQTLVLMSTKLSILLFYRRVFTVRFAGFRWGIYITFFCSLCSGIATFFVYTFQCIPVQLFWNRGYLVVPTPPPVSLEGHCLSATIHVVVPLFFDLATEIAILTLPTIALWKIQLPKRKKVGLTFAFSLGIFVTAISIIRLVYAFPLNVGLDMPWDDVNAIVWTAVQVSFGIVCACVPAMAPLYRLVKSKTKNRTKANTYGNSYGRHTDRVGTFTQNSRKGQATYEENWAAEETESTKGLKDKTDYEGVPEQQDWGRIRTVSNTITGGMKNGYQKQKDQIPMQKISVTRDVVVEG